MRPGGGGAAAAERKDVPASNIHAQSNLRSIRESETDSAGKSLEKKTAAEAAV